MLRPPDLTGHALLTRQDPPGVHPTSGQPSWDPAPARARHGFARVGARMTVLAFAALSLALGPALNVSPLQSVQAQTLTPSARVNLPSLGDADTDALSVAMERRYGEQIMRQLMRQPNYLDDPILLAYVDSLWRPLLDSAQARGDLGPELQEALAWQPFLVKERSVNAFALPGGHVGIHLGLIAMTRSPDELAAVLAHELTHITQRHIARGLTQAQRQGNLALAATLLGVLAAAAGGGDQVAHAAIVGSQAAVMQTQLSFSRDMEREADRIGEGVFRQAGFDPLGMAGMFEELDRAHRLNDSGAFPYLRTHPLTSDRLAEARARLPTLTATSARATPTLLHGLMVGRARALVATSTDAQEQALQVARRWLPPRARPAGAEARFQAAAALSSGAWAAAWTGDSGLMASCLDALDALLDLNEVSGPGQSGMAERALIQLLRLELPMRASGTAGSGGTRPHLAPESSANPPGNDASLAHWPRARLWLHAERLWRTGQPGPEAANRTVGQATPQDLQAGLSAHPRDAWLWDALARLHTGLGQTLRAQRARAEALAAQGDVDGALHQLRQAQSATRSAQGTDLIEAAVIDARVRQLVALRQRWAEDLRSLR